MKAKIFWLLIVCGCSDPMITDNTPRPGGGSVDSDASIDAAVANSDASLEPMDAETAFADAVAMDRSATDSAAMDSAAMDSAAMDSAAMDSAAMDSAAMDSATMDSAAIDAAAPDAAAVDSGPIDSGVITGNCPAGSGSGTSPNAQMSFFITSIGNGAAAGNYGGLSGADARCACLAAQVGRGNRTWRAYLSISSPLTNARDRIGSGPWYNYRGDLIATTVDALHNTPPSYALLLSERGDLAPRSEHDILTGSNSQGRLYTNGPPLTCGDWTNNSSGYYGYVGHSDWNAPTVPATNWNGWHETSCDQAGLNSRLGSGRIYCFAAD